VTIAGKRQFARLAGFVDLDASLLHVSLAGLGINDAHAGKIGFNLAGCKNATVI
jgi:hypothetical protein